MSDADILRVFVESSDPALSTTEVGDEIGISQQGAYNRLADLRDRDLITSKKFGNSVGWWITDAGREYLLRRD